MTERSHATTVLIKRDARRIARLCERGRGSKVRRA